MQNRLESSHRLNRCGRLPNKKSKLGGCPMPDGNIYQVRSCTIFMGIFPIHDSHNIWGAETAVNELNCCHSLFLQQGCRNSHKRTTQKSILLSSLDQHLNLAISLVFSLQHGSRKKRIFGGRKSRRSINHLNPSMPGQISRASYISL